MAKQNAGSGLGQSGDGEETGGRAKGTRARKAPRPGKCQKFVMARFAEALPEVAAKLLHEAKQGSVAHLKLVLQISGLDKGEVPRVRSKKREKNLEEILMEAWAKDAEEAKRFGVVPEVFPDTSGD